MEWNKDKIYFRNDRSISNPLSSSSLSLSIHLSISISISRKAGERGFRVLNRETSSGPALYVNLKNGFGNAGTLGKLARAIRLGGNLIYVNINSRSLAEFCVIRRNEFLGGRVLQV